MIVISGALVLVALVLLVIGLIGPSLGFVYASIAVSLASFGFLIVGILQRRKEDLPVADDDLALTEGVTAIIPATAGTSRFKGESAPAAASAPAAVAVAVPAPAPVEAVAGKVLVVAGRPRYHVAGCRYLTGKDAEWVEVAVAREEGFTACGVCRPDESLKSASATGTAAATEVLDTEPDIDEVPVTTRLARTAPTQTAPTTRGTAAAPTKKAPATKTAVTKPATTKAAVTKAAVTKAPAKQAPVKTAVAVAPTKKAAPAKKAAPIKRAGVIVIPDRGKYHTPECRYVRTAEDAVELSKATATRQGYEACGVCAP